MLLFMNHSEKLMPIINLNTYLGVSRKLQRTINVTQFAETDWFDQKLNSINTSLAAVYLRGQKSQEIRFPYFQIM